jgi:hypothetical protein
MWEAHKLRRGIMTLTRHTALCAHDLRAPLKVIIACGGSPIVCPVLLQGLRAAPACVAESGAISLQLSGTAPAGAVHAHASRSTSLCARRMPSMAEAQRAWLA